MTQPLDERTKAVSVDELKQAWGAVQAGQFRPSTRPPVRPGATWDGWALDAAERVLPVVGAHGSCGASTLALALATAAESPARVIECSSVTASGLAGASTAELGAHESGWVRGTRGRVLVERNSEVLTRAEDVPIPSVPDGGVGLSVLDVSWEAAQVLACRSWLAEQITGTGTVVMVTTATVPGVRRLEGVLGLVAGIRTCVAVVGLPRRKWPRAVESTVGPVTRALDRDGRLTQVPQIRALHVNGVDSTPLPPALLQAAAHLLQLACPTSTTDRKGQA